RPAGGDRRLAPLLARRDARRAAIDRANATALERLTSGAPFLVDCRPAREALELPERTVLHSGPPLPWERVSEPVRAAILGAIRYEGWAANDDAARELVERGAVRLEPCHHHATAGPMAGVVTPSMPVFVVENRAHGTRGHATINEGLGKVLRYGANDDSVLARLNWIATEAGPLLGAGLRALGGIDLRALMAQALRMADEMHQRNLAATALLTRAMMPGIAQVGGRHHAVARLAECAMVAAPAVARFLGAGGTAEAAAMTAEMREICAGEHPHFRIPALDDRGSPVGVDARLVVETSITPAINTGIASRRAGVGQ